MTRGTGEFTGLRQDPFTHRFHPGHGARAYDPVIMRFTCTDSWSPFGSGGVNPYAYCHGDPVNFVDPSGHMAWQTGLAIGLGIMSMVTALFTGGASLATAGSISAAVAALSARSALTVASAFIADATGLASAVTEERAPRVSGILGWLSFSAGLFAFGAGPYRGIARVFRKPHTARPTPRSSALLTGEPLRAGHELPVARSDVKPSWDSVRAYIDSTDNFEHRPVGHHIYSVDKHKSPHGIRNFFYNTYRKDVWIFEGNFRNNKNAPYFANDIARYQYEVISSEQGFYGQYPKEIIRSNVANEATLAQTAGRSGDSLYDAFFSTPNGKSIWRILEDFGLVATQVTREQARNGEISFVISLL